MQISEKDSLEKN